MAIVDLDFDFIFRMSAILVDPLDFRLKERLLLYYVAAVGVVFLVSPCRFYRFTVQHVVQEYMCTVGNQLFPVRQMSLASLVGNYIKKMKVKIMDMFCKIRYLFVSEFSFVLHFA